MDRVRAAKVALAVKRLNGNAEARDFHVRLMGMQGQINAGRALDLAEEMGLDRKRISEEMATPAIEAIISTNLAMAQRLGLTGTPSFIAGDQIIQGGCRKEASSGRDRSRPSKVSILQATASLGQTTIAE